MHVIPGSEARRKGCTTAVINSDKRKRGVLLSFQGWQRLQSAEQLFAVQHNAGNPYTLDQLSQLTGLSPNTLTKVRRRQKPVDFTTLDTYFQAFELVLEPTDLVAPEVNLITEPLDLVKNHPPKGSLSLGSPLYVYRPPIERLCFQEILSPGALVRVKAPRQFGKTSLITQILGYGQDQGFRSAIINLQLIEHASLGSPAQLLRGICASVSRSLALPNELETRWDDMFGATYSCTDYFESYLLPKCDRPLLLVMDGFDELFAFQEICIDFCGMLRAWYEQGRYGDKQEIWQRLRLVIAYSSEVWLPLSLHQSPFNVGLLVELPGFDLFQTKEMASRYDLDFAEADSHKLLHLVGGHPYLTQLSLFHLSQGTSLDELFASAIAYDGIFGGHLRRQLELIESDPDLTKAMILVVNHAAGVRIHPRDAYRLQGLGLVRFEAQLSFPSCELYRQYFATVLDS